MKLRTIILLISSFSFISLIIFLSLLLGEHLQVKSCGCPKMVSQNFIVLFIILSVIFVSGFVYFLLSLQLEKKQEKLEFNLETIIKFLDKDEKKILNRVKEEGEIKQSKIALSKVRVHRAVKKLWEKDLIKKEKYGRTNKLKLNKKFDLK